MNEVCRSLVIVLGDQLDPNSPALAQCDWNQDRLFMAEVRGESTRVWTHQARIAVFLASMRHFRDGLAKKGAAIDYVELLDDGNSGELLTEIEKAIERHRPQEVVLVQPGEWWIDDAIRKLCEKRQQPLQVLEDTHFMATASQFTKHAAGRKQLRMEYFYREMRRAYQILMDGDKPVGGKWNYDADNRGKFTKQGPGELPRPKAFRQSAVTKQVVALVQEQFAEHPGILEHFDWPVTPAQAKAALEDFVEHRLPWFGKYQDAMWTDEPYLYHSRISAAMNLKLLDPRDVIAAAVDAYERGHAPLNAVEGFVRQVLGWREYVRAIYWHFMPEYLQRNAMKANEPLPEFYWTAETDMHCLQQSIQQTLDYGYAHHIQRLMVTGLFALLLGVDPREVHRWYLAVYVDAIEWVELPNTLGMSQFGDGGVMASKPYVASGKYIQRMSNYCTGCRFNPAEATGEDACPFTTLYWDYLSRHQKELAGNQRMTMQLKNLERKSPNELVEITNIANELRTSLRQAVDSRVGSNEKA